MSRTSTFGITLLTILSLVVAGLPCYNPVDTNVDYSVDLRDAIIHVKKTLSPEKKANFVNDLGKALQALQVIAEFNDSLVSKAESNLSLITPQLDLPYLFENLELLDFIPKSFLVPLKIINLEYQIVFLPFRPPCLLSLS